MASQTSPDLYERLIQPREKRLVDAIHDAGGLVRLHICGNITHLLPGIAEMGIDILDVDHMVDMKATREAVGTGVVLSGNIDPVSDVRLGSPEKIRRIMRETYEAVGNPYMINAGCEIPPATPNENLKALCEEIPWRGVRSADTALCLSAATRTRVGGRCPPNLLPGSMLPGPYG